MTEIKSPGCTRQCDRELMLSTCNYAGYSEYFLILPLTGETAPADLFKHAACLLKEQNAAIFSIDVFGIGQGRGAMRAELERHLGPENWPVNWIEPADPDAPPSGGLIIHAIRNGGLTPLTHSGRAAACLFENEYGRWLRASGFLPEDVSLTDRDQARAVLEDMETVLNAADMNFSHVVRTWFYNRDILDWYSEFNRVRDTFFRERAVFSGVVPASTAVAGINPRAAALCAGLVAVQPRDKSVSVRPLPSPLQCPALDYGSSFSRAVEVETPDYRRVYLSGTASIDPDGNTEYRGDTAAQIARTMEVARAILQSRDMDWINTTRAILYFKDAKDIPLFAQWQQNNDCPLLPAIPVHCDICRDDLLFEIELDATLIR
jgi:enamine deaminase RidA (YjgF/YER057c/UK114 family)